MRHTYMMQTVLRGAASLALVLAAGCDSPSAAPDAGVDGGGPVLRRVQVMPDGQTVQAGASLRFAAAGTMSDGAASAPEVTWSATGGSITSDGSFTAGQTAGVFLVVAMAEGGVADSAAVVVAVPSTTPTLVAVRITPAGATVAAGGTVQLAAAGLFSNGTTAGVSVTWSATGGTVSGTGLYTAGAAPGTYAAIATGPGGLADTSAITVSAPGGGGGGGGSYTRLVGDDWTGYAGKDQLRSRDYFWWLDSRDVYNFVDLVPDATFGQVVRITFPVNSGTDAPSPQLQQGLPAPVDRMWYRWRVRFHPGWTTVGPDPAGHANSYKIAFWGWEGYWSRGEVGYTNTNEYYVGFSVQDPSSSRHLQYTETALPGTAATFGRTGTEWSDNEWYEFVSYYEKTGATTARQHYWRRRLTSGGAVSPGAWTYIGLAVSGSTTPRVNRVELGVNKNKSTPVQAYLYWGPWEVVDGTAHPNPFGMPNVP